MHCLFRNGKRTLWWRLAFQIFGKIISCLMSWYFTLLSQIYFRIKRIIIRQVFATLDNRNYIDNSNGKRWDRFYISSIFDGETVKIHFHEISNFLKPYAIYKIINSTKYIPKTIQLFTFGNIHRYTVFKCTTGVQNGNIYPSRNTACHRIDQQSARRRYRSLSCARRPVTVSKPLVLPGWRVIQSKAGGLGNVSRYKIRKESVGGSSESVIV